MNIYNLPEDKDFISDIMNDLKRAKRVVLISPFLSINVIKEWRDVFKNGSKKDFTIVYETNELSGEVKELLSDQVDKLKTKITWRHYEKLHSKIYYFEFDKGYSFYHGSANLTNSGVGNIEEGKISGNIEIMSRITSDTTSNKNIPDIIANYIKKSKIEVPNFIELSDSSNSTSDKQSIDDDIGIVQEYRKLLLRLEPNSTYVPANAKYILRKVDSDLKNVLGFFVSKNKRIKKFIKFHTTNIKGKSAEFAISWEELFWFTGEFYKNKCKTKNRMLYLVWKLDGSYEGRLIVFKLYPIDIFNLLKKSNKTKKLHFPYKSLTLSITKEEGDYVLKRYNSSVMIPANQVKCLPKVEV